MSERATIQRASAEVLQNRIPLADPMVATGVPVEIERRSVRLPPLQVDAPAPARAVAPPAPERLGFSGGCTPACKAFWPSRRLSRNA
jgi:hypothetical protein